MNIYVTQKSSFWIAVKRLTTTVVGALDHVAANFLAPCGSSRRVAL